MTKVIQVAVAILQKQNGEFLLASRPKNKGWAGWWEFPGGKIELNETPEQALSRELQEELAVTPKYIQPWIKRRYDYPQTHDAEAKTVLLHFYFVLEWDGEPTALEGQTLSWQTPDQIRVSPILPANAPIMHALSLPNIYAISNIAEMGEVAFMRALKTQLDLGLKLVQIREKQLSNADLTILARQIIKRCKPYQARVLINDHPEIASEVGADGVHFSSHTLMQLKQKPDHLLVAASCHNAQELQHAELLNLDFVVLSPVLHTQSHPDAKPMGWEIFEHLVAEKSLPIYALGGLHTKDINQALQCGARGIAMQRAIWQPNWDL
ncbi:MAG TPA: DNA mismatch repair protein MutT [Methylophilaceae bacterium]|nr:DNA mismatch repair protein MutT [Methylophilaceae bacterium]HAJ70540.1 DNA mismatch repair protein MutT [Methylophilaceae bacterium]